MDTQYIVAIIIIVVVAVIGYALLLWWRKGRKIVKPLTEFYEQGWQLFPKLTSGDPPGTVFRITPAKEKFPVDEIKDVPIIPDTEIQGKLVQEAEAGTEMVAKILGVKAELTASQKEKISIEMGDVKKEKTLDADIDKLVGPKMKTLTLRPDNKYFVIRVTRATKQIAIELKRETVDRLGGEGKIKEDTEAKATVFQQKDGTTFELKRTFHEPMRVMYLAEEIPLEKIEKFGGPPIIKVLDRIPAKEQARALLENTVEET